MFFISVVINLTLLMRKSVVARTQERPVKFIIESFNQVDLAKVMKKENAFI